MVYCGKPSKGCDQCRAKRTKCDTKRPFCGQCIRAGRVCGGYRDPVDLTFRDQTAALTGKRQRKIDTTVQHPSKVFILESNEFMTGSVIDIEPEILDQSWATDVIVPSLLPSIESQAICYFFRNYVLEDFSHSKGYFDYLAQMYHTEIISPALSDAVVSLGLLGIGTSGTDSKTITKATSKYNSALRATNLSLRNEEQAMADQTLITVMLLGLYETNACLSPRSMRSWTKHINGASAMLQLRGKEQLHTRVGYQLFAQLRTQIIVNCLHRAAPIPGYLLDWTQYASQFESNEETVGSTLGQIVIKYCNLRASLGPDREFGDSESTLALALEIDSELDAWMNSCPDYFAYDTVMMKEPSGSVFSDYYHVYPSIWIATVWNHYRSVRMLLNDMILGQLMSIKQRQFHYFDPSYDSAIHERQILASKSLLLQLTHDICASVPFYLDYHKAQNTLTSTDLPPRAAGGNLLLWPLFTAAVTDIISEIMRTWIIGRLEAIAETMGIRQAKALAYVLRIRKDILVWETSDGIRLPESSGDW